MINVKHKNLRLGGRNERKEIEQWLDCITGILRYCLDELRKVVDKIEGLQDPGEGEK